MKNNKYRKIINIILVIIFLIFAFVQLNDSDAALWFTIYSFVALVSIMAIFNYYPIKLIYGATIISILYMFFLLPAVIDWLSENDKSIFFDQMQYDKLFIEQSREFFGLLIVIFALVFHYISSRKSIKPIN